MAVQNDESREQALEPTRVGTRWFAATPAALLPYGSILVGLYGLGSAWAAILLYHAVAVLLLARWGEWPAPRRTMTTRGVDRSRLDRRGPGPSGWLGLVACAASGIALGLLYPALAIGPPLSEGLATFGLRGPALWAFALYHASVNPMIEERLWRVAPSGPRALGAMGDAAFAGYHLLAIAPFVGALGLVLSFVSIWIVGRYWRREARRPGGLTANVVAHTLADVSVMAFVLLRAH
jgi:hypothetical protein